MCQNVGTGRGTEQELSFRLENLESKIDRLTNLCCTSLNCDSSANGNGKERKSLSGNGQDQKVSSGNGQDQKTSSGNGQDRKCSYGNWLERKSVSGNGNDRKANATEAPSLSTSDEVALAGLDRYVIIGEILFQFERRVFNYVVPKSCRFYGYAVRNIEQLITREENVVDRVEFRANLTRLNNKLRPLGYLPYYHGELSCCIINEYGVLARSTSEIRAMSTRLENIPLLRRLICTTLPVNLRDDVLKLFECLICLTEEDGGKIFRF